MKLYNTETGILLDKAGQLYRIESDWDELVNRENLYSFLETTTFAETPRDLPDLYGSLLAPIGNQEIWAAGVTYFKSKTARMEEAKDAGGGQFYDRVYDAERPELFFKATPARTVGPGAKVRIRKDSKWNVPEPELTLLINAAGKIQGYTIGNDMSSRDIEGENPLYLPQAKSYDGSAAIGPCVLLTEQPLDLDTTISIHITRGEKVVFEGNTSLRQLKRSPEELVEFLYRECSFPSGAYLMTGTGIVPEDDFTLQSGDRIDIEIAPIGVLSNVVA